MDVGFQVQDPLATYGNCVPCNSVTGGLTEPTDLYKSVHITGNHEMVNPQAHAMCALFVNVDLTI